jgi:hypothetical protein
MTGLWTVTVGTTGFGIVIWIVGLGMLTPACAPATDSAKADVVASAARSLESCDMISSLGLGTSHLVPLTPWTDASRFFCALTDGFPSAHPQTTKGLTR